MSDMECPYCGADQAVCHDDGQGYDEFKKHEHECSECEKTFVFETQISFDYTPYRADCLNGAAHELEYRHSWPKEYSRMCCKHCDYKRKATSQEIDAHNIKEES